jgi:uncharacterized protein YbcV (DUF1398 family)
MAIRPKVGGFPYLAETLRRAGVTRNTGSLPACQSIFLTNDGPVVMQGDPLVSGLSDIPAFDREGLIKALRTDQAGESTFPEFLAASWRAGVVRYDVDFAARTVAYRLQRRAVCGSLCRGGHRISIALLIGDAIPWLRVIAIHGNF